MNYAAIFYIMGYRHRTVFGNGWLLYRQGVELRTGQVVNK